MRPFTRRVTELLTDDEDRELQLALAARPDAGEVIPGSGGIRKLRWKRPGTGKRGGVRVLYFHRERLGRIDLLHLLARSERGDLSRRELGLLKRVVEEELP